MCLIKIGNVNMVNVICFEDKKGEEEVWFYVEKD